MDISIGRANEIRRAGIEMRIVVLEEKINED
jgi:hypothetical protein